MIPLYRKGLVRLGRLLLRSTVLRPFGLSRQEASHRFAPLPHIADLRCLNDNPPPVPSVTAPPPGFWSRSA
jgi:hypothetical protein